MVYVDAANTSTSDTNIMLRFSDDNGATWSAPVQVNDDATSRSHFNPAIAVDQTTGDVAVTWYDARNSASNTTVQIFGGVSDDGGLSFGADFQISAGTTSCLVGGGFNCGDYDKMTFDQGRFWRTWADSSNSTGDNPDGTGALDIYTAAVTVTTVPEPSTWLLLASAAGLLAAVHGRSGRHRWSSPRRTYRVLLNPLISLFGGVLLTHTGSQFRKRIRFWLEAVRLLWPDCPARISASGNAMTIGRSTS